MMFLMRTERKDKQGIEIYKMEEEMERPNLANQT